MLLNEPDDLEAGENTGTIVKPAGAAPVVPPVAAPAGEAAKPELVFTDPVPPAKPAAEEFDVVEYNKTGDAGLDLALQFVGQRGIDDKSPGMVAAMKGDFSVLEKVLKDMGDKAKGYEAYLDVAKKSFERSAADTSSKAQATEAAVLKIAGGKENWDAVFAWAKANADEAEKVQLNDMFKAGGLQAQSAARYLTDLWRQHGTSVPGKSAVKDEAGNVQAVSNGALSPKDYGREVVKLSQKLGRKMETSSEYAALTARRQAFRG